MTTYTATVSFQVFDIEADDLKEADRKVNKLIDDLTFTETELVWDNVEWTIA